QSRALAAALWRRSQHHRATARVGRLRLYSARSFAQKFSVRPDGQGSTLGSVTPDPRPVEPAFHALAGRHRPAKARRQFGASPGADERDWRAYRTRKPGLALGRRTKARSFTRANSRLRGAAATRFTRGVRVLTAYHLRQHRQPFTAARCGASSGNRRSAGARRYALAAGAATGQ